MFDRLRVRGVGAGGRWRRGALAAAMVAGVLTPVLSSPAGAVGSNDDLADAIAMTGNSGVLVSQDVDAATMEPGEAHGNGAGQQSVWYQFAAPGTGQLRVWTSGNQFDTILSAYTGNSISSLVAVAENDDDYLPFGTRSEVFFPVRLGTNYKLALSSFSSAASGATESDLHWEFMPTACGITIPNPFIDVAAGTWYHDPVVWLFQQNITQGTSQGVFSPTVIVTRQQMAVFLHTMFGSPPPVAPHSFPGIKPWANDAVSWLVQRQITSGTSPGQFSPSAPVTRGQMAIFMWRTVGSPAPGMTHSFVDVSKNPTNILGNAVSWMIRENNTAGTTPTSYGPSGKVTRAQMAAFLNKWACP
jgi:hypothetical protein